jgi:branched-chain amino acid transport system substrate-binding protein
VPRGTTVWAASIAVGLATALAACGASEESDGGSATEGPATIAIGANVEVTGAAASIGEYWKQGVELGVHAVNAAGGVEIDGKRYTFKADVQDNQTNPQTGISIAQRFIDGEVKFVFGPGTSVLFPPAFESLRGTETVVFTPSATGGEYLGKPEGKHLFITKVTDPDAIAAAVDAVSQKYTPKSVAYLEPSDPAGESHRAAFLDAFKAAGIEVVYEDAFDPATTDFGPYVARMKTKAPDMVVFGYLNKWAQPFYEQAVAQDFTAPVFFGAPGVDTAALEGLDEIKRAAFAMPTRSVTNEGDPAIAAFQKTYQDLYGKAPTDNAFWCLTYYDSVLMLAKAMETAKTTTDLDAISAALASPAAAEYEGRALDLTYDEKHQSHYSPQTLFMDDGQLSYVAGGS